MTARAARLAAQNEALLAEVARRRGMEPWRAKALRELHHEECVCSQCRPHVRHDSTSLYVDRATDEVRYPCTRLVYGADSDGMTHTGAYDIGYVTCFGCQQAHAKRIEENERNRRRNAEWLAMTDAERGAELKRFGEAFKGVA